MKKTFASNHRAVKSFVLGLSVFAFCSLPLTFYPSPFTSSSIVSCLFAGKGTTSGQFLGMGLGARAMSLGGAYTGLADDVNALYWNPAGIVQIENKEMSLMHSVWVEGISHDYFAYSNGTFGLGVNMLQAGNIDKYDNAGNKVGQTYTASDVNAALSYASQFGGTSVGVTLKDIMSRIEDESASTFCADAGLFFNYWNSFKFGIMAQNIGGSLKFRNESFPLPMNTKLGFSYSGFGSFVLSGDVVSSSDQGLFECFGVEYPLGILNLRGGYSTGVSGFDTLSGVSAGFGMKLKSFLIDYAWGAFGDLGATNTVSVSMKFGGSKEMPEQKTAVSKSETKDGVSKQAIKTEKKSSLNIGVLDFSALAPISMSEATFTTEIFRSALVQAKKYTIVDRSNMEKVLTEQGLQNSGCTTTECAVKMGKMLNVSKIVSGTFGKLGEHYLLTINVIDVETSEIVFSTKASCKQLTPDDVQLMADKLIAAMVKEIK